MRRGGIRQGTMCQSSNLLWQNARTRFIFIYEWRLTFFESFSRKAKLKRLPINLPHVGILWARKKIIYSTFRLPFYVSIERVDGNVPSRGKLAFWAFAKIYRSFSDIIDRLVHVELLLGLSLIKSNRAQRDESLMIIDLARLRLNLLASMLTEPSMLFGARIRKRSVA